MLLITVDTKAIERTLSDLDRNQLPYATQKALNKTALAVQNAERSEWRDTFLIRRSWVLQGVKINREDFATKERLEARVHLDASRDFMAKFEAGGVKVPHDGGRSIAIPKEIRTSPRQVLGPGVRPRAFGFPKQPQRTGPLAQVFLLSRARRVIKRGKVSGIDYNQVQRLFMIRRFDGTGGIYERVGHGRRSRTRLLYRFTPEAHIPEMLNWELTAELTVREAWPREIEEALRYAIATAR